jgi:hypothetical protein
MRVEITSELDPGDSRLEIPWAAGRARRYRDLKAFPEEIAALPECRAYPPLAALLGRLNAPRSPLRTAKCDVWETTKLARDEWADFRLPSKTGSYVDVVFDAPRLRRQRAPHQRLAEQIVRGLKSFRASAQLDIVLRRCLFHPEEVWGYALTFFLHAYGPTARQARHEWARALPHLGRALLNAPRLSQSRGHAPR